jgi:hypothetical protein
VGVALDREAEVLAKSAVVVVVVLERRASVRTVEVDCLHVGAHVDCLVNVVEHLLSAHRDVALKDGDCKVVTNVVCSVGVVVALSFRIIIIFETEATEEELANVLTDSVLDHKLTTWVGHDVILDIKDQVFDDAELLSILDGCIKLCSRHSSLNVKAGLELYSGAHLVLVVRLTAKENAAPEHHVPEKHPDGEGLTLSEDSAVEARHDSDLNNDYAEVAEVVVDVPGQIDVLCVPG